MRTQSGFSMIEFLIAMILGLFLVAGAGMVYVNTKATFREDKAVSSLQENGRFALEVLTRDLRLAGFVGCSNLSNLTNTLNNPTAYGNNFSLPIQGFEAGTSTWTPSLDSAITAGGVTPLAGRDILTLRRPEGSAFGLSAPWMVTSSDAPHVDPASISPDKIQQAYFVLVSDCNAAAVFQVSNSDVVSSGNLSHAAGGSSPGNATANLGNTFVKGALALRMVTATYFIAASQQNPGSNALWLRLGSDAPVELAEGIDDMQILYGEDTDFDLTANRYVSADKVSDMRNVVSVRISFLASTVDDGITSQPQPYSFNGSAAITPSDRRLRSVFTTVVNIRNRTP